MFSRFFHHSPPRWLVAAAAILMAIIVSVPRRDTPLPRIQLQPVAALRGFSGAFALSPDGSRLALYRDLGKGVWSSPAELEIWDTRTWKRLAVLERLPNSRSSAGLAFSPDGMVLAFVYQRPISYPLQRLRRLYQRFPHMNAVEAQREYDRWMMEARADADRLQLWDTQTWRLQRVLRPCPGIVAPLAFSPDGRFMATGRDAGHGCDAATVTVWNTRSWSPVRTVSDPLCLAEAVSFSPDSRQLLVSGGGSWDSAGGGVFVWDLCAGRLLRRWAGPGHSEYAGAFSAGGTQLITCGGGLAEWDTKTWRRIRMRLDADAYWTLPTGGRFLLFQSDARRETVQVCDPRTWKPVAEAPDIADIWWRVEISPDWRVWITGTRDGEWVRVWTTTGADLHDPHLL